MPRFHRLAGTRSLSYRLPLIWNWLPKEMKSLKSASEFGGQVLSFLQDPVYLSRLKSLVFDNVTSCNFVSDSGLLIVVRVVLLRFRCKIK